jgi:hypothetical protein
MSSTLMGTPQTSGQRRLIRLALVLPAAIALLTGYVLPSLETV